SQCCRTPIVGQSGRYGYSRASGLLVGIVGVLKSQVGKKLVLNDGCSQFASGSVTMKLRNFVTCGNVGIGIVEERRRVERIGSAMHIPAPVEIVGSRGSAHVDVRAAGGPLLRVIHGGVYPEFLDRFCSRRGQCLTNGQIRGGGALDRLRSSTGKAGRSADSRVVHEAC